jgi:non-lysosomal glucosylceramidase
LRAAEEMARAMGDPASAAEYRRLFENGSRWIDANLFNGEYYVQKIIGYAPDKIAPALRSGMGSDDSEHPQFQVGTGCLVDQLVGQYLAEVAGLGPLLDPAKIRKTLDSIYRYNHKASMAQHDTVQRTFALNDESALVICDYGKSKRPHIPFPYYAEVMTGFEYSAANLMLYSGNTERGVACVEDIRKRYDGVRRNPWDEAECGHHYARAMAAWSGVLALSGFRYRGAEKAVTACPRIPYGGSQFRSFWSAASGWGTFSLISHAEESQLALSVDLGSLAVRTLEFQSTGNGAGIASLNGKPLEHTLERKNGRVKFTLAREVQVGEDGQLALRG